jgi:hypothetical protein
MAVCRAVGVMLLWACLLLGGWIALIMAVLTGSTRCLWVQQVRVADVHYHVLCVKHIQGVVRYLQ